ncbi:hypothetical protein IPN41_04380 [Candidatus Falkowbacteria bacterium]|nr:MAG: hypothetical protein IPN41_04380 [Candidatus Falkowbacteria bacterium]
MEARTYQLSSAFDGLVNEGVFFYEGLLRDRPLEKNQALATHFNDLYHLFLNKFARLTYDPTLSKEQEEDLKILLADLLATRRALEEQET